jgi:hypothetical protein
MAALKAKLNETTGKLEMFVDGRTACPDIYGMMVEVNATKGMAMPVDPFFIFDFVLHRTQLLVCFFLFFIVVPW